MWYYVIAVYVLAAVLTYVCVSKKWDSPKFEKIWFSIFWPVLIPLWIAHAIHNTLKKED